MKSAIAFRTGAQYLWGEPAEMVEELVRHGAEIAELLEIVERMPVGKKHLEGTQWVCGQWYGREVSAGLSVVNVEQLDQRRRALEAQLTHLGDTGDEDYVLELKTELEQIEAQLEEAG